MGRAGRFHVSRECTLPKMLVFIFTTLLTLLIVHFFKTIVDDHWYYKEAICHQKPDMFDDLAEMAEKIHTLLKQNRITHFMCYGTLWGAMRIQKTLPWDTDMDLCLFDAEISALDYNDLFNQFHSENLGFQYDSRRGIYEVRYGQAKADLMVFEESSDGEWFERTGWENKFIFYAPNHRFPTSLVQPLLGSMKFHGLDLPAPQKPIELQKYLYPDDWWKEVKPPGC